MTVIAIAVLAILLAVLIVKTTKEDIKDIGGAYTDFIKSIFTRKTLTEFTDDLKHAGATLVKAGKQIIRALNLVGCWLLLPVAAVLIPVIATIVIAYKAFTK